MLLVSTPVWCPKPSFFPSVVPRFFLSSSAFLPSYLLLFLVNFGPPNLLSCCWTSLARQSGAPSLPSLLPTIGPGQTASLGHRGLSPVLWLSLVWHNTVPLHQPWNAIFRKHVCRPPRCCVGRPINAPSSRHANDQGYRMVGHDQRRAGPRQQGRSANCWVLTCWLQIGRTRHARFEMRFVWGTVGVSVTNCKHIACAICALVCL